ncbi:MAG: phosphate/phosphite/phosphonate ABC transporter substrate-binding protein, partial [Polyangiales bacterium]
MQELLLGAVAYDPKVVTIWEGMRSYFRDEAKLDLEVVLFLNYEAQARALLASKIDIAWNTNLAYVQCQHKSEGRCEPLAMRDTDLGWKSLLLALAGGPVRSIADVKGKRIALGSKDSGHAAILPVHFLGENGLVEGRDFETLRFDLDVGKHGDTGTSEIDVLKAVLDGRADCGFVGSPFWAGVRQKQLVPTAGIAEVWTSPAYTHCMFTARVGLAQEARDAFTRALFAMSFDDPRHRPVLEAE